jgi:hypothetical protein
LSPPYKNNEFLLGIRLKLIIAAKFHREGDITYIDEIAAIISFNLIPRRNSLFL